MRKTTPVREWMSKLPAEVDRHEPLEAVVREMRANHCHHVPIMDGAHLFGILSREDLHELALHEGVRKRVAGDVCCRDLLTVGPMTPVIEVAEAMLERGVGSALVIDGDLLVGIFTSTDALRVLAEW
jgi:acetoin utilization protein AcuB